MTDWIAVHRGKVARGEMCAGPGCFRLLYPRGEPQLCAECRARAREDQQQNNGPPEDEAAEEES